MTQKTKTSFFIIALTVVMAVFLAYFLLDRLK